MRHRKLHKPIFCKDFADDVLGFDPDITTGGGIADVVMPFSDVSEDLVKGVTGQTAADEAKAAAKSAQSAQLQGLDYLKESQAVPMEYRDLALGQLGGLFGLTDGFDKAGFVESLKQDPFYETMIRDAEESVLRGQGAGGKRFSGSTDVALASIAPSILQNMYSERVGGLSGLAGAQGYAPQIAQMYSDMGQTAAMGQMGAAQARQSGMGQLLGLGSSLGMLAFSDPSLKTNAVIIDNVKGLPWYAWEWNEKANELGLSGTGCGFMADDVKEKYPDCVKQVGENLAVDYGGIFSE